MRNALTFLSVVALAALFTSGCAGPEEKLGRGMSNFPKLPAWAKCASPSSKPPCLSRPTPATPSDLFAVSTAPWRAPEWAFLKSSLFRSRPIIPFTYSPRPVYPDSYTPGLISDSMFDTDTYIGFSGGDVAPFVPGSRFKVFDNN